MGLSKDMLRKPIVGIAQTGSGFNNCHRTMPELVEAVSRGVLAAGGLPRPFPTTSLGEVFLNPTSMVYRNLMAMDTEEMVRAQPMDAVVLIGGCDKTVPAQLMGAASANIPAVQLVTGPMMTGRHKGERLGACTDCRRFGAGIVQAKSRARKSTLLRGGWRRLLAPVLSWGRQALWPAFPKRLACRCPEAQLSLRCIRIDWWRRNSAERLRST
jgi:dihydroxyacid dehydratase/phosphogluconate dehydratase